MEESEKKKTPEECALSTLRFMDGLLIDFPLKLKLQRELICRGVITTGGITDSK